MADAIDDGLIKALEAIAAVVEDYERDGYSDRYNDDEAILGRVQWKSADYPDLPPRVTWGQLKAIREALSRHKAPLSVAGDDVERFKVAIEQALIGGFTPDLEQVVIDTWPAVWIALTALQVTEGDKLREAIQTAIANAKPLIDAQPATDFTSDLIEQVISPLRAALHSKQGERG